MSATVMAGELMVTRAGSVTPANFPDEKFDLYSIPAYDRGSSEITVGNTIGSAKQVVRPGDVLLSKIVPHIRRAWVVGPNRGHRMIASGEWIVFRNERLHTRYLRHVLVGDSFHVQFMNTVAGIGGSLLRARPSFVAKIQIPLPPMEEQRRIAAILDQADALRAKSREALDHLDDLTQSIFFDMFGDPVVALERWPNKSLQDVTAAINDCPHSTPIWTESGEICLRTSNLGKGSWNWSDTRYVSATAYVERAKRGELQPGDIVLSREGTVGIAAIVRSDMRLCMGQRLVQVRANPDLVLPEFLLQFLLGALAPERIGHVMVGSTARHLNVKELRSLRIPTPPQRQQVEFVRWARAVEILQSSAQVHLAKLDSLFASLQSRAFAGKL